MSVAGSQKRRAGARALDLLEEAVGLLRRTPVDALFAYLIGAVPFWLGLLYFLSDMSQNAYAPRHITEASLGVALLYLWMKCWQTVFTAKLWSTVTDRPGEPWSVGRVLRLIGTQAAWQPWGFIIRPIAMVATFPYGWMVAFFQNLTVFGDGTTGHDESVSARAWSMARLWPGQTHYALSVLWVFGFFVWVNVMAALGFAPVALKMFLGIETTFSRSVDAFLNTTFLTTSFALASLFVDPLWKAVFVIRCFRGRALRTGEDLAVDLKKARIVSRAPALALLALSLAFGAMNGQAAEPATAPTIEATELDQKIGEVLERREYAWRAPREELPEVKDEGWFSAWMRGIGKATESSLKAVAQKVGKVIEALLDKLFKPPKVPAVSGSWDWAGAAKAFIVILGAVCILALCWALFRLVLHLLGLRRNPVTEAVAIAAKPDLRSENIVADQLPEDGWLELAREHAAAGNFQLALRAAWLACLAHLGQRELLSIARHKSNRDYDRELQRRARLRDELLAAFSENLGAFERAWYGRHTVEPDDYAVFQGNLERIRAC